MSFRPRNYQEALEYINARRDPYREDRVISREHLRKGVPSQIRDRLLLHTADPSTSYGDNPPPISFRQWNTNIATFYPGGSIAITPHDSATTRDRMSDMNLPCTRSALAMGLTKNQAARLEGETRVEMRGFPYGVPMRDSYLLNERRELDSMEPEPTETIYVEPYEGVHKQFQLGRKRVLKVLKEYAEMVSAMLDQDIPQSGGPGAGLRDEMLTTMLNAPSMAVLRDEWLPGLVDLAPGSGEGKPRLVAHYYHMAKEYCGLYSRMNDARLWAKQEVKSRELDQWL